MEIDIGWIITIVLGILAALFGAKFTDKATKIKMVWKEVKELGDTTFAALDDNKLTKEEITNIAKEGRDVILAIRNIVAVGKKA